MRNQETTREQRLQREKTLFRYISALERGDIETISAVLHEAEHDPILEQMIFETHATLQQEETMDYPQPFYDHNTPTYPVAPGQLNTYREPAPQPRRRRRGWIAAFSTLAAVLIATFLLASALLLFTTHRPATTNNNHNTHVGGSSHKIQTIDPGVEVFYTRDGVLHAYNASNGKALWQFRTNTFPQNQEINGPVGLLVQQHAVYFASKGKIYAINSTTGKQLWHTSMHTSDQWTVTNTKGQIFSDQGKLFVSGFAGPQWNTLYVLNNTTGKLLWKYHNNVDTQLLAESNGVAYVASGDTSVAPKDAQYGIKALDANTGRQLWFAATPYQGSSEPLSAVINKDVLYVLAADSLVLDPNGFHKEQKPLSALHITNGKQLWMHTISLNGAGPLYVANNSLVAFNGGTNNQSNSGLCAYSITSGQQQWCKQSYSNMAATANGDMSFTIHDGIVYSTAFVGSSTLKLEITAQDLTTGKTLWSKTASASGTFAGLLTYWNGKLYVPHFPSTLLTYDGQNGRLLLQTQVPVSKTLWSTDYAVGA